MLDHQQDREASRSTPEQNALESQERSREMGSTRRRGAYAHACRGALQLPGGYLVTGGSGREGPQLGSPVVFTSRSCWRASWVGLPACGAAHWGLLSVADPFGVQAGPPICASASAHAPGNSKVAVAPIFTISGSRGACVGTHREEEWVPMPTQRRQVDTSPERLSVRRQCTAEW